MTALLATIRGGPELLLRHNIAPVAAAGLRVGQVPGGSRPCTRPADTVSRTPAAWCFGREVSHPPPAFKH
jgi:hypothetical protein